MPALIFVSLVAPLETGATGGSAEQNYKRDTSGKLAAANKFQANEPLCRVKDSSAGYANARNEPNLSGPVVGKLKSGSIIYPGNSATDERRVVWIKIRKSPRDTGLRHG